MILILSNVKETLGRRKWQFTPVFLPGTSHGKRSLACYRPGGCEELDMTERQHTEKLGGKNLDVTRRFFAIRLKLKWAQTEKDDFINILLSPYRIIYCTLSSTFIIEHLFFFFNKCTQCSNLGHTDFITRQEVLETGKLPYTAFAHPAQSL